MQKLISDQYKGLPLFSLFENNIILSNTTNTITIKTGTCFFWNDGTFPRYKYVDVDVTLSSLGTSKTIYIYYTPTGFNFSENVGTFNSQKQGWYNSDGVVIAVAKINSSGDIEFLFAINGKAKEKGEFTSLGLEYNRANNTVIVKKPTIDINGTLIKYYTDIIFNLDVAWDHLDWITIYVNEATGIFSLTKLSNLTGAGGTNWTGTTLASNKLNMLQIFDEDRNYCHEFSNSIHKRISFIFQFLKYPSSVQTFGTTSVSCTSTLGLSKNMYITGHTNIPTNTYITSIDSPTTFTINNSATGSSTETTTFTKVGISKKINQKPKTYIEIQRDDILIGTTETRIPWNILVFDINSELAPDTYNIEFKSEKNVNVFIVPEIFIEGSGAGTSFIKPYIDDELKFMLCSTEQISGQLFSITGPYSFDVKKYTVLYLQALANSGSFTLKCKLIIQEV